MRSKAIFILSLGVIIAIVGCSPKPKLAPLDKTVPTAPISLPKDLAAHEWAKHEWWYYTGHLVAQDGRRFGFELTIFRFRVDDKPSWKYRLAGITHTGFMGHFAVVDESTGRHRPVLLMVPAGKDAEASPDQYEIKLRSWFARGDEKNHQLHAEAKDLAITLDLVAFKPPALHGDNGIVMKSESIGNYYLSITRMSVAGRLRLGQEEIPVEGTAWFDHEFGYMGDLKSGGWDWYSIQLDDNSEFMIYVIRNAAGAIEPMSQACRIEADGTEQCIPYAEIEIEVLGRWLSPHTESLYPSGWRIRIPQWSADLIIVPTVADQEFPKGPIIYWEGACKVMGSHQGRSFIELVGYKPRQAPP